MNKKSLLLSSAAAHINHGDETVVMFLSFERSQRINDYNNILPTDSGFLLVNTDIDFKSYKSFIQIFLIGP